MIELTLTADAERYGRDRKARYERDGVKDIFKLPGYDKRWTGHAVEYALHQFFSDQAIPHIWHYDGLGNKPDFVLGTDGIKVASKANSGDLARKDFVFTVPEKHVHKLGDGALFSIVQIREHKLWVAGYITGQKFRSLAQKRKKGEEGFVPGRPIEYDCRTITANVLEPAERFFELLRRAA